MTCPLIVAATELEWREALAADLGRGAVYALHGWLLHWLFDRLRPVDGVPLSSPACNAC